MIGDLGKLNILARPDRSSSGGAKASDSSSNKSASGADAASEFKNVLGNDLRESRRSQKSLADAAERRSEKQADRRAESKSNRESRNESQIPTQSRPRTNTESNAQRREIEESSSNRASDRAGDRVSERRSTGSPSASRKEPVRTGGPSATPSGPYADRTSDSTNVEGATEEKEFFVDSSASEAETNASPKTNGRNVSRGEKSDEKISELETRKIEDPAMVAVSGLANVNAMSNRFFREDAPVDAPTSNVIDLNAYRERQSEIKQKAVSSFIEQMQAQFSITPHQVVQAFAELDVSTLSGPPEEAMEQFLAQFNLTPGERAKAANLYQDLVQTTGEADLRDKLAQAQLDANFTVVDSRDLKLRELNQSLDQMNLNFFRKNPIAQAALSEQNSLGPSAAGSTKSESRDSKSGLSSTGSFMVNQVMNSPFGFVSGTAQSATAAGAAGAAASASAMTGAEGIGATSANALGSQNFQTQGATANAGIDPSQGAMVNASSMNVESRWIDEAMAPMTPKNFSAAKTKSAKSAYAQGESNASTAAAEMKSFTSTSAAESAATNARGEAPLTGAGAPVPSSSSAVSGPSVPTTPANMMMTGPKVSEDDKAANINEIVRQAQVIARKGGGEMRMELRPEGLGHVNLKVAVENGQVNVQMVADSDSTKKLIETSLGDLKASLVAHKLHVDNVRIETNTELQKHFDQARDDAHREQSRQFASDFMGQFRDERQAFHQAFMDNPGWRTYNRDPNRAKVDPEKVNAPSYSSSARPVASEKNQRRLNLVA